MRLRLRALLVPILLLALTTPFAAPLAAQAARTARPRAAARTILFVGNSFTFGDAAGGPDLVRPFGANTVNDLTGEGIGGIPALFEHFTTQAGLAWDVSLATRPAVGLDYHYNNRLALINRRWDAVVLQSYSTLDAARPGDPATLVTYTALLADSLRARNAKVEIHLLATWSRADQTYLPGGHWHGRPIDAMAKQVEQGYETARRRARGITSIIPVGAAWTRAIRTGFADANPFDGMDGGKVDLWAPDGYHASVFGSYLEALVIFGAVTGVDPRTLGANESAAKTLGISPKRAVTMQTIAWEELQSRRNGGSP